MNNLTIHLEEDIVRAEYFWARLMTRCLIPVFAVLLTLGILSNYQFFMTVDFFSEKSRKSSNAVLLQCLAFSESIAIFNCFLYMADFSIPV